VRSDCLLQVDTVYSSPPHVLSCDLFPPNSWGIPRKTSLTPPLFWVLPPLSGLLFPFPHAPVFVRLPDRARPGRTTISLRSRIRERSYVPSANVSPSLVLSRSSACPFSGPTEARKHFSGTWKLILAVLFSVRSVVSQKVLTDRWLFAFLLAPHRPPPAWFSTAPESFLPPHAAT